MDLTEASPNNSAIRADRPLGHRERATGSAPSAAGGGAVAPPGGRSPHMHPPGWQRARSGVVALPALCFVLAWLYLEIRTDISLCVPKSAPKSVSLCTDGRDNFAPKVMPPSCFRGNCNKEHNDAANCRLKKVMFFNTSMGAVSSA